MSRTNSQTPPGPTLEDIGKVVQARALLETFLAEQELLEEVRTRAIDMLYQTWRSLAGKSNSLSRAFIHQLLCRYPPGLVEMAFRAVAPKVQSGYLDGRENRAKYLWATLRNMAAQAHELALYQEEDE